MAVRPMPRPCIANLTLTLVLSGLAAPCAIGQERARPVRPDAPTLPLPGAGRAAAKAPAVDARLGLDLLREAAQPRRAAFWERARARLEHRFAQRSHRANPGAFVDLLPGLARSVPAGAEDREGFDAFGDETRHGLLAVAAADLRRMARKTLRDALRQEPAYEDLTGLARPFGLSGGGAGLLLDADEDDPGPAPPAATGRSADLDLLDLEPRSSLGMHPRLGFAWLDLYRLKWEPREGKLAHRLAFAAGGVGVRADWKFRDGAPAGQSVGLALPLGPMSLATVAASRSPRGDDGSGGRSIEAGVVCRF